MTSKPNTANHSARLYQMNIFEESKRSLQVVISNLKAQVQTSIKPISILDIFPQILYFIKNSNLENVNDRIKLLSSFAPLESYFVKTAFSNKCTIFGTFTFYWQIFSKVFWKISPNFVLNIQNELEALKEAVVANPLHSAGVESIISIHESHPDNVELLITSLSNFKSILKGNGPEQDCFAGIQKKIDSFKEIEDFREFVKTIDSIIATQEIAFQTSYNEKDLEKFTNMSLSYSLLCTETISYFDQNYISELIEVEQIIYYVKSFAAPKDLAELTKLLTIKAEAKFRSTPIVAPCIITDIENVVQSNYPDSIQPFSEFNSSYKKLFEGQVDRPVSYLAGVFLDLLTFEDGIEIDDNQLDLQKNLNDLMVVICLQIISRSIFEDSLVLDEYMASYPIPQNQLFLNIKKLINAATELKNNEIIDTKYVNFFERFILMFRSLYKLLIMVQQNILSKTIETFCQYIPPLFSMQGLIKKKYLDILKSGNPSIELLSTQAVLTTSEIIDRVKQYIIQMNSRHSGPTVEDTHIIAIFLFYYCASQFFTNYVPKNSSVSDYVLCIEPNQTSLEFQQLGEALIEFIEEKSFININLVEKFFSINLVSIYKNCQNEPTIQDLYKSLCEKLYIPKLPITFFEMIEFIKAAILSHKGEGSESLKYIKSCFEALEQMDLNIDYEKLEKTASTLQTTFGKANIITNSIITFTKFLKVFYRTANKMAEIGNDFHTYDVAASSLIQVLLISNIAVSMEGIFIGYPQILQKLHQVFPFSVSQVSACDKSAIAPLIEGLQQILQGPSSRSDDELFKVVQSYIYSFSVFIRSNQENKELNEEVKKMVSIAILFPKQGPNFAAQYEKYHSELLVALITLRKFIAQSQLIKKCFLTDWLTSEVDEITTIILVSSIRVWSADYSRVSLQMISKVPEAIRPDFNYNSQQVYVTTTLKEPTPDICISFDFPAVQNLVTASRRVQDRKQYELIQKLSRVLRDQTVKIDSGKFFFKNASLLSMQESMIQEIERNVAKVSEEIERIREIKAKQPELIKQKIQQFNSDLEQSQSKVASEKSRLEILLTELQKIEEKNQARKKELEGLKSSISAEDVLVLSRGLHLDNDDDKSDDIHQQLEIDQYVDAVKSQNDKLRLAIKRRRLMSEVPGLLENDADDNYIKIAEDLKKKIAELSAPAIKNTKEDFFLPMPQDVSNLLAFCVNVNTKTPTKDSVFKKKDSLLKFIDSTIGFITQMKNNRETMKELKK